MEPAPRMLYRTTLRHPGDFSEFQISSCTDTSPFLKRLREIMVNLSLIPNSERNKSLIFVHPFLESCSHIFVQNGGAKKPL